jgi:hypothetical protein
MRLSVNAKQDISYLLPPRRLELNSVTPNSNETCDSGVTKRWPKSGTDSAKTPELHQNQSDPGKYMPTCCSKRCPPPAPNRKWHTLDKGYAAQNNF